MKKQILKRNVISRFVLVALTFFVTMNIATLSALAEGEEKSGTVCANPTPAYLSVEELSLTGNTTCDTDVVKQRKIEAKVQEILLQQEETLQAAEKAAIADNLNGEMEGEIDLFYDKAKELELDPVFAVALASWETGYGKSNICVNKHNFGGMRGQGEWMQFSDKEAGIEAFLNLLVSYHSKGLDTPEKMASRYASNSDTWASNVKNIMKDIQRDIDVKQEEVRAETEVKITGIRQS